MNIHIRQMTAQDQDQLIDIEEAFIVDSALVLSLKDHRLAYTVQERPHYVKRYAEDSPDAANTEHSAEAAGDLDSADRVLYVAFSGGRAVGKLVLRRNWNRYAYIEDIQVDQHVRRQGIGRRLMEQAKQWTVEQELPGIMLETQNNNVGACRLYESCGFVLGGFDSFLYKGFNKHSDEIALFWYWLRE
ncbi:GNAT family N-acetyltransferase [Paenibacillus filicis]|uniref:GNAT family N-acetyltransferase n=1 Tax=Paenibacillus filicis TaxID=669464 RepID=A0ABU9DFJ7_9BACL